MLTHGDKEQAAHNMYNAIYDFVIFSNQLGQNLNDKEVFTAKKPGVAKIIVQTSANTGIIYTATDNIRELGSGLVHKQLNIRDNKKTKTHRTDNSKGTLNNIYNLAQLSSRTRVLFSGAGCSNAMWAFQASGLFHSE